MRPSVFISGATCALLFAAHRARSDPAALSDSQYAALGKRYTDWFFNGRADSIAAHMAPETREAVGGAAGILDQRDRVTARAGEEKLVMDEKMTWRSGMPQFWHEGMFDVPGRAAGAALGDERTGTDRRCRPRAQEPDAGTGLHRRPTSRSATGNPAGARAGLEVGCPARAP